MSPAELAKGALMALELRINQATAFLARRGSEALIIAAAVTASPSARRDDDHQGDALAHRAHQ